jgi:hypothetical protein
MYRPGNSKPRLSLSHNDSLLEAIRLTDRFIRVIFELELPFLSVYDGQSLLDCAIVG